MWRHMVFAISVSILGAVGGMVGCGGVDASVETWCYVDGACECDGAGNCCIIENSYCYDGQCCDGLVCSEKGRCVPE